MNAKLKAVRTYDDILPAYRDSPVGDLLAYHNLYMPWRKLDRARLVIGMCMDHRKVLRMPDRFAYVLRAGGANLRHIEFKLAYAVAVEGVRALALVGHDDCGMVGLTRKRETFVQGLVENGGWSADEAGAFFDANAAQFEIEDPMEFVQSEARRLRLRYPALTVAPLMYSVREGALYQVVEEHEARAGGVDRRLRVLGPEDVSRSGTA